MAEEKFDKELWLRQLTAAYDGELPYKNETEVINWLRHRYEATGGKEERSRLRELIEEASAQSHEKGSIEEYGGTDDWGELSPELVKFARLLELLKLRAQL